MTIAIAGMDLTCLMQSVEKYEIPSQECVLPLLSKFLGYAIVFASVFLKLPQIFLILKNKSTKGLSIPSFELEVAGFTIALAYCLFKNLPFSAYGELVFILAQSIACLALIYYYSGNLGLSTWVKTAVYCALAPTLLTGKVDGQVIEALYACQHAIFFSARLPQIYENFRNKSTGQLSFVTSFLSFVGCVVRAFTSVQEKAPGSMLVGCLLGILTHGTVCSQIIAYSSSEKVVTKSKKVE